MEKQYDPYKRALELYIGKSVEIRSGWSFGNGELLDINEHVVIFRSYGKHGIVTVPMRKVDEIKYY